MSTNLEDLYVDQKRTWQLFSDGVDALNGLKTREVIVQGDTIKVQFNPARAVSTLAKIDAAAIKARPCFLCKANRPTEQHGFFVLDGQYIVLCNPRPVFPYHFTVSKEEHLPQEILGIEDEFLEVAKEFGSEYVIFFNGAKAGASAPDHLHFQGCKAYSLPLIQKIEGTAVITFAGISYLAICGEKKFVADKVHQVIEEHYKKYPIGLINVYGRYLNGEFQALLALRSAHRPNCYATARFLISPASIEMAGVLITVREEDFDTITSSEIEAALKEVSCTTEYVKQLYELVTSLK